MTASKERKGEQRIWPAAAAAAAVSVPVSAPVSAATTAGAAPGWNGLEWWCQQQWKPGWHGPGHSSRDRGSSDDKAKGAVVIEAVSDDKAKGAVVDLPGGRAVIQSRSTPPSPQATYTRHRTHHTLRGPKAVLQRFAPMVLARDATAATRLVVAIRNVRRTSSAG